MALATKCPHCQTTFRVAHDQLKLRAGLVRCGHCKEIFNGIEHLLPPEKPAVKTDSSAAPASSSPPVEPVSSPLTEETQQAALITATEPVAIATQETEEKTQENPSEETVLATDTPAAAASITSRLAFDIPPHFEREFPAPELDEKPVDPLQRMTLMDFTSVSDDDRDETTNEQKYSRAEADMPMFDPHAPDELDEAIEDLQRKPWRRSRTKNKVRQEESNELDEEEAEDAAEEEPSFIRHGRRKQRIGRKLRNFLIAGSCVLLIAATLQGIYIFRNQLAGMFPQTKPWLVQACDLFGCRINLPAQINAVSIESSELQTMADNADMFVLTTLLRNNSSTLQEWPYIELTLNDGNEKPLLRRVFRPSDYASNEEVRQGFAPASERPAKLAFQLQQVKASGYRVYLFYP